MLSNWPLHTIEEIFVDLNLFSDPVDNQQTKESMYQGEQILDCFDNDDDYSEDREIVQQNSPAKADVEFNGQQDIVARAMSCDDTPSQAVDDDKTVEIDEKSDNMRDICENFGKKIDNGEADDVINAIFKNCYQNNMDVLEYGNEVKDNDENVQEISQEPPAVYNEEFDLITELEELEVPSICHILGNNNKEEFVEQYNNIPENISMKNKQPCSPFSTTSTTKSANQKMRPSIVDDPKIRQKAELIKASCNSYFGTSHQKHPMIHQFLGCLIRDQHKFNSQRLVFFCDSNGQETENPSDHIFVKNTVVVGVLWGLMKSNRNYDYGTFSRGLRKSRENGNEAGYFDFQEITKIVPGKKKCAKKKIIKLGKKSIDEYAARFNWRFSV